MSSCRLKDAFSSSDTPALRKQVHISIGDFHASRRPCVIYTLLGSCVAACLFDPVSRIGGMNHILMPGRADLSRFDMAARYGINAMELLINRIMNLGGDRRNLVAKIFGGAHTLAAIPRENGMGQKNITFLTSFLKNEGIRILSQDTGGTRSRKIFFHTDIGDVFLRRGRVVNHSPLIRTERVMCEQVKTEIGKPGDVTFFNNAGE
ncbi:chemotaxis protein CheD [Desulfonema ishimotonii]|uniref:chemotaxis protein CheD n=1 Tax=Desulfonema ishimotonii TaxID=45657 RepID=UPI001E359468|nr:chemotaxis protein CheD [Desulfonema ishimotonii]